MGLSGENSPPAEKYGADQAGRQGDAIRSSDTCLLQGWLPMTTAFTLTTRTRQWINSSHNSS